MRTVVWTVLIFVFVISMGGRSVWAQPILQPQAGDVEQRVAALEQYAESLSDVIDHQIKFASQRIIRLSIVSKNYQSILTNSGNFLVAVDELKQAKDGYHLMLRIGNLSAANFQGYNVHLRWGLNWDPKSTQPFKEWRSSLKGADFDFQGSLEQGHWTPIDLILGKLERGNLAYIEMELDVSAVEMIGK